MELITATQLIEPLDLDLKVIHKFLNEKLKKAEPPTTVYLGASVYFLGDDSNGYVVLEKDKEIHYFVKYKLVKHNAIKFGRQILVWRKPGSLQATGFARMVFFNYLLPKYKALIADTQQSPAGKQFWLNATQYALEKGKLVYFLDRRSNPNRLLDITSMDDLGKYEDEIWGTIPQFKLTFAVISEVKLALKE